MINVSSVARKLGYHTYVNYDLLHTVTVIVIRRTRWVAHVTTALPLEEFRETN